MFIITIDADFAILDITPISGSNLSTLVIACPYRMTSAGKVYYNYAVASYAQTP
jgi:hypothetical protein